MNDSINDTSQEPTLYFGWALNLGYQGRTNDTDFFAVNLVMPGAAYNSDWSSAGENDRWKPTSKSVSETFCDLLFPWSWGDSNKSNDKLKWQVFCVRRDDGLPLGEGIDGTIICDSDMVPDQKSKIQDAIRAEVVSKVEHCNDPFSLAQTCNGTSKDHDEHIQTSLPHTLAPLTHLPAPMSDSVLGLSLHLKTEKLVNEEFYVCFPVRFKANGSNFHLINKGDKFLERIGGWRANLNDDPIIVQATYYVESENSEQKSPGKFEVEGRPCHIVFHCQSVRILKPSVKQEPKKIEKVSETTLSNSQFRSFVARYAHPAVVVARLLKILEERARTAEEKISKSGNQGADPDYGFDLYQDDSWTWFRRLFAYCVGSGSIRALIGPTETTIGYFPSIFFSRRELDALNWDTSVLAGDTIWGVIAPKSLGLVNELIVLLKDAETPDAIAVGAALNKAKEDFEKDDKNRRELKPREFKRSALIANASSCLDNLVAAASNPSSDVFFAIVAALNNNVLSTSSPKTFNAIKPRLDDLRKKKGNLRGFASNAWIHRLSTIKNAWTKSGQHDDPCGNVKAIHSELKKELSPDAFQIPSKELEQAISELFEAASKDYDHSKEPTKIKDSPLRIRFENEDNVVKDSEIRGYAIAIQSGIHPKNGDDVLPAQTQWVTATGLTMPALQTNGNNGFVQKNGKKLLMHETIGSTWDAGFRVVTTDYSGRPLNATRPKALTPSATNNGSNGSEPIITNVWPPENIYASDALPLLGYGLYYRAVSIEVDNAGGMVNDWGVPDCEIRSSDSLRKLFEKDLWVTTDPRYLSSVLPGPPRIVWDESVKNGRSTTSKAPDLPLGSTRYSGETKASAYMAHLENASATSTTSQSASKRPPVFALIPKNSKIYVETGFLRSEYIFTIHPALADEDVIERWFNTDVVAANDKTKFGYLLSNESLKDPVWSATNISMLATYWFEKLKDSHIQSGKGHYHPAVTAFRVSAEWRDGTNRSELLILTNLLTPDIISAKEIDISKVLPRLKIVSPTKTENPVKPEMKPPSDRVLEIIVPIGDFVKVTIESLVSSELIGDGPRARLKQGHIRPIDGEFTPVSEAEYWFECLPKWDKESVHWNDDIINIPWNDLNIVQERVMLKTTSSLCDAPDWLAGVKLERHEWHWTGYDVKFPVSGNSGDELKDWLPAMVATATYRESSESLLRVKWKDETDIKNWSIPPQPIADVELPRERGAKFFAYTASPILRFHDWIKPDIRKEMMSKIAATGRVVYGHAIEKTYLDRPPSPGWAWSIPLCATYDSNGSAAGTNASKTQRIANGNLLVLDEAIRRTDDLVRLGGIGEVIELDILETRIAGINEQGLNPIFHGLKEKNKTGDMRFDPKWLSFNVSHTFGLTYDISTNPKVAQTGLIVVPEYDPETPEEEKGKWVMAKMRARRIYLPELMCSPRIITKKDKNTDLSKILKDNNIVGLSEKNVWTLKTRIVEDKRVPIDFCIDVPNDKQSPTQLIIVASDTSHPYQIKLKKDDKNKRDVSKALKKTDCDRRLLVSWHFGQWRGTDEPNWRPQVLWQEPIDCNKIGWRTIEKISPYQIPYEEDGQTKPFLIPLSVLEVSLLGDFDNSITPQPVLVSDYSEAQWLTFIGSFGRELDVSSNYRLFRKEDELELKRLINKRWFSEKLGIAPPSGTNATFQLLMEYSPVKDLMRGSPDITSGAISGFWEPSSSDSSRFQKFPIGDFTNSCQVSNFELENSGNSKRQRFAYLLSFQRINASQDKKTFVSPNSWATILNCMFPEQVSPKGANAAAEPDQDAKLKNEKHVSVEARIRLLPEYLGPILIEG